MASLQASWLSSFNTISPIKTSLFLSTDVSKSHPFKPFRVTFSLNSTNDESSERISGNSPDPASENELAPIDPVKLAFAKTKAYKKSVQPSSKLKIEQNPDKDSDGTTSKNSGSSLVSNGDSGETKEVTDSVKIAMEKAKGYEKNKGMVDNGMNVGENDKTSGLKETSMRNSGTESVKKKADKKGELSISSIDFMGLNFADKKKSRGLPPGPVPVADPFPEGDIPEMEIIVGDSSKLTYGKTGELGLVANGGSDETKEVPDSVKIAMEKAKEYKKNKGMEDGSINRVESNKISGLEEETSNGNSDTGSVERKADKKGKLSISSVDFVGLNFADKKTGRRLPAGLVPVEDLFPEGDIPEVEIIVGDTSKFTDEKSTNSDQAQGIESDSYKPKVSSWGVFPRPSKISKTFGGGRVIKPGEALETVEEKAAKEKRTRELLAAYKRKSGFNIDAKLKAECEEVLKDGDSLMNLGKLEEALPYYEKVMEKLPFQSELHGLAALRWSICQDSLRRSNEARVMYEKLQSHSNAQVSKKARQFMFSFQAMEMMKVTTSSPSLKNTGYQNYFEAFVENKANYPLKEVEDEVGSLSQTLPYIFLLVSPIFLVLLIAVQKRI